MERVQVLHVCIKVLLETLIANIQVFLLVSDVGKLCVGFLQSCFPNGKNFRFPESILCSPISAFLDDSAQSCAATAESPNAQANIEEHLLRREIVAVILIKNAF